MKEIITFLIVSGGLGFFNLYIAQESDLLYFGKYNKEERLAWLSIYSGLNFMSIKLAILISNISNSLAYGKMLSLVFIVAILTLNIIVTLVLPIVINKMIELVRRLMNKGPRSYLPPTNVFFEEIEQWSLYAFDFDGNMINAGSILHATEERQEDFTLIIRPTLPESENYSDFLSAASEGAQQGLIKMRELTDYTNKVHFIKIKDI